MLRLFVGVDVPYNAELDALMRLVKSSGAEDKKYEDLAKRDFEELQMGIGNVIAMADYVLTNEGDVEDFISRGIELAEKVSRDP